MCSRLRNRRSLGKFTAFISAGADIIETNTFNANAISMSDYHMEGLVLN